MAIFSIIVSLRIAYINDTVALQISQGKQT